jgi:hypothetical protein
MGALLWRKNLRDLRGIDRHRHAAIDDLHLTTCRLIRDSRYLSLDNFAAVEADPDSGAYAVVHKSKYILTAA